MAAARTAKKPAKKAAKATKKAGGRRPRSTGVRAKAPRSSKSKGMSAEHKAALAHGRQEGNVVRAYLDALDAHKPKRGRKVSPDDVRSRITAIEEEIKETRGGKKLDLVQARRNAEMQLEELESAANGFDIVQLQKNFVKVAKSYAKRKGINYGTFREVGVPAQVLTDAGITRSM